MSATRAICIHRLLSSVGHGPGHLVDAARAFRFGLPRRLRPCGDYALYDSRVVSTETADANRAELVIELSYALGADVERASDIADRHRVREHHLHSYVTDWHFASQL